MRMRDWLSAVIVGLFIGGCAGMQTGASVETKAAVAPTGKLRVAFLLVPIYANKDPATGDLKGVAIDLGKELARRVGVPFETVVYTGVPALIGGAKSGEWDVALIGIDAQRAIVMDFSAPFMNVEQGYLVRAGVPIAAALDVDKPGIRVGVLEKSTVDALLSKSVKSATLVRVKSLPDNYALLDAGKTDVMAATKPALFAGAESRPGTRVLDGQFPADPTGMGVPKGRNATAAAYVGKFVEEAKVEGLVKSAIERAGLRGVVVAPLK